MEWELDGWKGKSPCKIKCATPQVSTTLSALPQQLSIVESVD